MQDERLEKLVNHLKALAAAAPTRKKIRRKRRESSLDYIIRTKEQADAFMAALKATLG